MEVPGIAYTTTQANRRLPIPTARLAGYPNRAHASRTGATFINLAMASKTRNRIARPLIIRPAQTLFFDKGAVCGAECANSEAWVADCINFLRLPSIKDQQGAGFPDRLDQLNLALYTRRTSSPEIDTSDDFFFAQATNVTIATSCALVRRRRPGKVDLALSNGT